MAEEKKILLDIQINYTALSKQLEDTKKKIDDLFVEQVRLNGAFKSAELSKNTAAMEQLSTELLKNKAETKALTTEQRNLEKQATLIAQAQKAEAGSYEESLRVQQLKEISLKNLSQTMAVNAEGHVILTDKFKKESAEVLKGKEALLNFNAGIKDGRLNVGNYASSILDAAKSSGLLTGELGELSEIFHKTREATEVVGQGLKIVKDNAAQTVNAVRDWFTTTNAAGEATTDTFKGMESSAKGAVKGFETVSKASSASADAAVASSQAITAALAATGIGLVVIALGLVINYLRQVDPIIDKFEQGIAFIGEALYEVGKGIFEFGTEIVENLLNPLKLLELINPISLVKRIAGIGEAAVVAGNKAADLKKLMQDLEDQERLNTITLTKNNIEAKKNRDLSDDRTKSAKDRVKFLEDAQKIELENLRITVDAAKKQLDIDRAALEAKGGLAKANDDLKDKYIASLNALQQANGAFNNKEIADAAEKSKKILKEQKDRIDGEVALLNELVRAEELKGNEVFEIRKEVLAKQLSAELSQSDLSTEQKLSLQAKYQNDLTALEKEKQAFRDKLLTDAAAARAAANQQEIDLEFRKQKALLEARKAEANPQDTSAQYKLRLEEINLQLVNEAALKERAREDDLAKSEIALGLQLESLRSNGDFKALTLEQQDVEVTAIIENGRQRETKINEAYDAENIARIKAAAKDITDTTQETTDKQIQQALRLAQLKADAQFPNTQAALDAQLELLNEQEKQEAAAAERQFADQAQRYEALKDIHQRFENAKEQITISSEQSRLSTVSSTLGASLSLLKKGSNEYKIIASSQAVIDTTRAAIAAVAPPPTGLGPVFGVPLAAITIANGFAQIAKINAVKFAIGGRTTTGDKTISVADAVENYQPKWIQTFSKGGRFETPSLGLIGEEGTELVIRNKVLKQNPGFFNMIEQWNTTGVSPFSQEVRPFASGGYSIGADTLSAYLAPLQVQFTKPQPNIIIQSSPSPAIDYDQLANVMASKLQGVKIITDVQRVTQVQTEIRTEESYGVI